MAERVGTVGGHMALKDTLAPSDRNSLVSRCRRQTRALSWKP